MKNLKFALLFVLIAGSLNAQFLPGGTQTNLQPVGYNDCAAIFKNDKMLVDDFSPRGKCKMEIGTDDKLTVATVALNDEGARKTKDLEFHVAIKNERTSTYFLVTKEPVMSIDWPTIYKQCEEGDKVIILTTDNKYALPHAEIELIWGC